MTLNDDQLDICSEQLGYLTESELRQLIKDRIIKYDTKKELINYIEDHFIKEDWEWFYEEYITGVE